MCACHQLNPQKHFFKIGFHLLLLSVNSYYIRKWDLSPDVTGGLTSGHPDTGGDGTADNILLPLQMKGKQRPYKYFYS